MKFNAKSWINKKHEFGTDKWIKGNLLILIPLFIIYVALVAWPWFYEANPYRIVSMIFGIPLILPYGIAVVTRPNIGSELLVSMMKYGAVYIMLSPYYFYICIKAEAEIEGIKLVAKNLKNNQ